jgi:hypothetical protein
MHSRFARMVAILIFALSSTQLIAVGDPTVKGSLPRGTTTGSVTLTVVVTGITNAALLTDEKTLAQRMRVWFTDVSASTDAYLRIQGDMTTPADAKFYVASVSEPEKSAGASASLTTFTYTLTVTESTSGNLSALLKASGGGTSLKVQVSYLEKNAIVSTSSITTISADLAIVKEAPTISSVASTHRALIVRWNIPETVAWSDASVKAATNIAGMAIPDDTDGINLPSRIYDKTATSDAAGADETCQYIPSFADGTNCISCTNDLAYLDVEALTKLDQNGKIPVIADVASGKLTITGLDNDRNYGVVLFYQPGGLQRSLCFHGTPSTNVTWSELNGEKAATLQDPKCFIATAAYGSPLNRNLKPLRWFRDQVLLKTSVGSRFVAWYYENGPRAARVVAGSPALQLIVQAMLWIPVAGISVWMAILNTDPSFLRMALGALISALIVAVYIHRKYREIN